MFEIKAQGETGSRILQRNKNEYKTLSTKWNLYISHICYAMYLCCR